ncbi:MAG: tRNA (cytidine(34)-2'-O)-methyltransferase [Phycisphaerales bacterium]|nr:tRNA (cytidine(34)-2'-O)-methyltransferase [Phycisphaerales bacterium]
MSPLFHIVLHEPEIPNNTGNIGRTCIATGCALHLIRPLGFDTGVKALRRAGLDYWPRLGVREWDNWESYRGAMGLGGGSGGRLWMLAPRVPRMIWDADLRPGDHLVFGKETAGLPDAMLAAHADRLVALPMLEGERSLNLATVVCAAVYEGVRQCVARGELRVDAGGRMTRPG